MFFLCQIFLRKCKKWRKKDTLNIIDGLFFPFLNIYLFLFNTQLLVRVEFIDICHLLFEAVLPEWGIVGLTGFSGCKWSPGEDVCRKNLFSRKVIYPSLSAGSNENFKLCFVSPLICWVIVLCHSCVSIRFISRSGLLSIVVYWILIRVGGPWSPGVGLNERKIFSFLWSY